MIDRERMAKLAGGYGIDLSSGQLNLLNIYAEELVSRNRRANLTRITEAEEIEEKHFLDSLIFADNPLVRGKVADVGSGAGFPGVVAKIYKPDLKLWTIEPLLKRAEFLTSLRQRLGIDFEILRERAEEAAPKGYREVFDSVTARAVAPLPMLCEYCIPLVKPGGFFIAMKGREDQVQSAMKAIETLGGEYVETLLFSLPRAGERRLVIIKKVSPTPPGYPRNGGKIKKKPL